MLRNAYGTKTTFLADLAHKTEMLVRQNATAHGLDKMTKTVEFDEAALQMLKDGQAPDAGKVINLARSLVEFGAREGEHDPMLMGIAERAEAVLEAFTERQTSTLQALDRLKVLMEEKRAFEDERKHWRGDASEFAIFWTLRRENLPSPEVVAGEIAAGFKRFPNYQTSADELRQLKAEIYKALLRVVSGKRMVDLAEEFLKSARS